MPEKKLKINLIITRLDAGGSAEVTLLLAKGLSQKGHNITLITGETTNPPFDINKFANENGFTITRIQELRRSINPFLDLIAFVKLHSLLKRLKPTIVHTNTSKAGILGRFAGAMAGCKNIVHSPHGHIFYGYYSPPITSFFVALEKLAARYTKYILTLTYIGKKDHIHKKIARPQKFIVTGCGIELSRFTNIQRVKNKRFTITWIGRLTGIKNPFLLLRAAKLLKEKGYSFRYEIIGNGELLSKCENYVKENSLNSVYFYGYQREVERFLARADLLAVTSNNEGFGRVIIEAMAAGVPVIATRVGGIPELIKHNVNGILITPGSAEELCAGIIKLYTESNLREKFVNYNRKFCKRFDISNYINKIEKIYRKVLND